MSDVAINPASANEGASSKQQAAGVQDEPAKEEKPRTLNIKKTCEGCAKSKVKCKGQHPCERCVKRGVDCEFIPEQKRGRRSLSDQANSPDKKTIKLQSENDNSKGSANRPVVDSRTPPPAEVPVRPMAVPVTHPYMLGVPFPGMIGAQQPVIMPPNIFPRPVFTTAQPGAATVTFRNPLTPAWPSVPQFQVPAQPQAPVPRPSLIRLIRTLFALYRYRGTNGLKGESSKKWFQYYFGKSMLVLQQAFPADAVEAIKSWMTKHELQGSAETLQVSPIVDGKSSPQTLRLQPTLPRGVTHLIGEIEIVPGQSRSYGPALQMFTGYVASDIGNEFMNVECLPWGAEFLLVLGAEENIAYTFIETVLSALDVAKRGNLRTVMWCLPCAIRLKTGPICNTYIKCSGTLTEANADNFASIKIGFYFASHDVAFPPSQPAQSMGPWFPWPTPTTESINALTRWVDGASSH